MQFSRKKKQHGDTGVVITSLLDINFLLIMFFLMTAHFQRETHALLNLPQERGEENAQPDEAGLVINILENGDVVVSNNSVQMDELRSMVRAQIDKMKSAGVSGTDSSTLKLMIRADREASTQDLNRVVFLLRDVGVGTIRIATEVPTL
jgi:biopolymer transport protein ExbD